jgi:hypothetical protein
MLLQDTDLYKRMKVAEMHDISLLGVFPTMTLLKPSCESAANYLRVCVQNSPVSVLACFM